MDEEESPQVIVIDSGSWSIKAGFSGDDTPISVFPNVAGYANVDGGGNNSSSGGNNKDIRQCYVGNEAQARRERLALRNPIEGGEIKDWDTMEEVWHYTFENELGMSSDGMKMPVLMTDSPAISSIAQQNRKVRLYILSLWFIYIIYTYVHRKWQR